MVTKKARTIKALMINPRCEEMARWYFSNQFCPSFTLSNDIKRSESILSSVSCCSETNPAIWVKIFCNSERVPSIFSTAVTFRLVDKMEVVCCIGIGIETVPPVSGPSEYEDVKSFWTRFRWRRTEWEWKKENLLEFLLEHQLVVVELL